MMSATGKRENSEGLLKQAAGVAEDLARSGWRLSLLPALAMPQSLRGPLFGGIRWWTEAVAGVLPGPFAGSVDGFADDLDDLEGRVVRREDLGSRLRREQRRAARGG